MNLLTAVFATHPPARVEILNSCQAKLIGWTEAQSLPYLCVLGRLVRDYPGLIASHLPSLKVRSTLSAQTCTAASFLSKG